MKKTQKVKQLFFLMKPYWKYARILMSYWFFEAIVLEPVIVIANTTIMQIIIDAIVSGKALCDIITVACGYSILVLGISLLRRTVTILYAERKNIEVMHLIKKEVYNKAIKTDYKYFDNPEFYDNYTNTINQYANQCASAVDVFFQLLSTFTTIVSVATIIALLGPLIVVIIVVAIALSTMIQIKLNKKYMERYERGLPSERKTNYIHRILYMKEYAADIKTSNIMYFLNNKYSLAVNERIGVFKNCSKSILFWTYLYTGVFTVKDIAVVSYIVWGIIRGTISHVGMYTTLISASGNLTNSLNRFFSGVSSLDKLALYANKIQKFFEFDSFIENRMDTPNSIISDGAFEIDLKQASFSYPNSNFAMKNISMHIPKGAKIAIVGENGAGKSTLAKLFLRLYDLESGEILINGKSIKDYDVKDLRKRIGTAFQSPNIYALSIAENLQLYNEIDDCNLMSILDKAKLTSVLVKSGGTIQTELTKEFSQDGIVLSKGEQQKLSLARLMSGDFGLVLLDEPSSALDPIAEYEMAKLFFGQANNTTTIMIAHRLSTVRDADVIFLIDNGSVVEYGNHNELIEMKGKYYNMFMKQAENYVR